MACFGDRINRVLSEMAGCFRRPSRVENPATICNRKTRGGFRAGRRVASAALVWDIRSSAVLLNRQSAWIPTRAASGPGTGTEGGSAVVVRAFSRVGEAQEVSDFG